MDTKPMNPITGTQEAGVLSKIDPVNSLDDLAGTAPIVEPGNKSKGTNPTYGNSLYSKIALSVAALATMAATSYASLMADFNTVYKGANPDGTHKWETTITNLSPHTSSDYAILELDIPGALRDGSSVGTDKFLDLLSYENQASNPQDNKFTMGTDFSFDYILASNGSPGFDNIMKINYTTPADFDRLAEGTITAYAYGAGQIDVVGNVVIPEPAAIALIGMAAGGMLFARRRLGG